ncbi:MAG: glycosyltransferase family 2 protein [Mucilaginibacter polytrichastri]|nr:glycosyltransferase family 2 protein [Mucilaginibacter polytrichastri]
MEEMPLVTIAIPFFNNEKTIVDAVKSVFAQSYLNWELLLINDGSTDGADAFLSNILDKRVKLFSDGKNLGRVYRLNQVPSIAKGKYIARMDGDDLMHPLRIEKQVAFLEAHPEIDIIDTSTYTIDENNFPIGVRNLGALELNRRDLLTRSLFTHPAVMAKRNWFASNAYDPFFARAEDMDLWLRSYSETRHGRLREPLLFYREGRVNVKNYFLTMKEVRHILRKHGPLFGDRRTIAFEYLKTYFKASLYGIFGIFGLQNILSAKRNDPLDHNQREQITKIIQQIRAQELF